MRNFHFPGRSPTVARNAMVATSSALASTQALKVLENGGNAIDAAITAASILNVCEPHMTGIGGDCFALISLPNGEIVGLNGSGRASENATPSWLEKADLGEIHKDTIHTVTVPGAIDAWHTLLEAYGTYSLADALAPAISHAYDGVPTGQRTASDWGNEVCRLSADEGSTKHLLLNGRSPRFGETMAFPALARSLEKIANEGPDAFYRGELTDDMINTLGLRGSLLNHRDFAATKASWCKPISTKFAGREIFELPPNGQGITTLISLNILKHFDLAGLKPDSSERWHLEIEAMKQATIIQHRHVADPKYMTMTVEELLSEQLAQQMFNAIKLDAANNSPEASMVKPGSDTVYLSVIDKNGMAVSFINSVFSSFGSGVTTPKSGINFQNRGACFETDPNHPNCIGPAKRPRHTIIPALVHKNGQLEAVFGVMGGAYQPMGHQSVLLNRYIFGLDPQAALDAPRLFHQDGTVGIEKNVNVRIANGLNEMGHKLQALPGPLGGGQFIHTDNDLKVLIAGSDHRKDGLAVGI